MVLYSDDKIHLRNGLQYFHYFISFYIYGRVQSVACISCCLIIGSDIMQTLFTNVNFTYSFVYIYKYSCLCMSFYLTLKGSCGVLCVVNTSS